MNDDDGERRMELGLGFTLLILIEPLSKIFKDQKQIFRDQNLKKYSYLKSVHPNCEIGSITITSYFSCFTFFANILFESFA